MPTKPQNSSRQMVLPAYKAAISPGPPPSHTTLSNPASLPSATQLAHLANSIRATQYEIRYTRCDMRNTKYDIRITPYDLRDTRCQIRACPPRRLSAGGGFGGRQATSNKTRATTCEIRYTGDVRRICPLLLSRILYKFALLCKTNPISLWRI